MLPSDTHHIPVPDSVVSPSAVDAQLHELVDALLNARTRAPLARFHLRLPVPITPHAHLTLGGVTHIARLTSLTSLECSFCYTSQLHHRGVKLTHMYDDDMLEMLCTLPCLAELTLTHCQHVTDDGIAQLAASAAGTRLTSIHLRHVLRLTGAIWPRLARITCLCSLSLTDGPGLSYAGVSRFVQLAAVSFRAAHTQRVAATPHVLVPPPSLSFHVTCAPAVSAADMIASMFLSQWPRPYPCRTIMVSAWRA